MRSEATTVAEYLKELPAERRKIVKAVRQAVNESIQPGFVEVMNWGMITWEIPLERYPKTYNKKPLMFCSLAAQKRHYALYMMHVYEESEHMDAIRRAYEDAGLKLDMGKCCLRFRALDEIHLPIVRELISACTLDQFLAHYESCRKK